MYVCINILCQLYLNINSRNSENILLIFMNSLLNISLKLRTFFILKLFYGLKLKKFI